MATLYRKYRPQAFAEVVGQNHIKLALEYELKSGRLAHAYLFCGPRAVGKTTLSRVLAKSLNCLQRPEGSAEPCNQCANCRSIVEGSALDIVEIDAASHTGVDNVRDNIIAGARISPVAMKYKVFIIDEVHMLSSAAFNALLKVMEEPPANVVFVLCTTEVHKIPSTIISRCQRFDFKKISVIDIINKLEYILAAEGIAADKSVLEAIARYSGGHMRDAESALGQIVALAERQSDDQLLTLTKEQAELVIPRSGLDQAVKFIDLLVVKDTANAIRLINLLLDDGYDLKNFLAETIDLLRQLLLIKINPELLPAMGVDLGESATTGLLSVGEKTGVAWLLKALQALLPVKLALKEGSLGQLPLELAVVELGELATKNTLTNPTKNVNMSSVQVDQSNNQPSVSPTPPSGDLSVVWSNFLHQAKQNNATLSFSLGVAKPLNLTDSHLSISLKHKLHHSRLSEATVKATAEKLLTEVCGRPMLLEIVLEDVTSVPIVDQRVEATEPKNDPIIDEMLKAFGGQIVG